MPRGDGTGPRGIGPMTGRMSGFCVGYGMPEYEYQMLRQGFRNGYGRRRGFWNDRGYGMRFMNRAGRFFVWMPYDREHSAFSPASSQEDDEQFLQSQAEVLKRRLDKIQRKIDRLAIYETKKE